MADIKLHNVDKIYYGKKHQVEALKNVNLEIKQGEAVAIMGVSGSGKSTLLNILGLLDSPTNGQYLINNEDVSGKKDVELSNMRNKIFGFVLQDFALIDRYSVKKNLEIPLIYSDVKKSDWKDKIDEVLEKLGISELLDRYPLELSGGQRQRVAIARAIINDASIILADEPTGALDSSNTMKIVNLFKEINSMGKTVIIVTHDHDVAKNFDRIIEIRDGKLYE